MDIIFSFYKSVKMYREQKLNLKSSLMFKNILEITSSTGRSCTSSKSSCQKDRFDAKNTFDKFQ